MAKTRVKTVTAYCPACDTRIRFSERPQLLDIVSCPECDEFFEVASISPITLRWVDDDNIGEEYPEPDDDWQ